MTKFSRISLESEVINLFLSVLRDKLTDPRSPKRTNTNWIRSEMQVRKNTPDPNKRTFIKNSEFVGYPEVIVEEFKTKNQQKTIYINSNVNYEVSCELTIRILDINSVVNTGNLGSQIEYVLENYRTKFMGDGITKLEWDNIGTGSYASDDNDFNERQILVTFVARCSSWQTGA